MTARAEETHPDATGDRPLRRDAERNRQRILTAAAQVFTDHGLDATLDEVARAAGVGIGTVYRRFPDKETLVTELFRDRIDSLVTVAEKACLAADAWQGLIAYIEFAAHALASDSGLRELMMFGTYDRAKVCYARERMQPVITRLVQRAQATGELRADFQATDVKMIAFMLGSVTDYAAPVNPDLWRRYLSLLLDGLRTSRTDCTKLPVDALTATELEELMKGRTRRPAPRPRA